MSARSIMRSIGAVEALESPVPIRMVSPGLPTAAVVVCRRQFTNWPTSRTAPPAPPYHDYQHRNRGYWIEAGDGPGFAETTVRNLLAQDGWHAHWVTWSSGSPVFRMAPRRGVTAALEGAGATWFDAIWREKERRRSILAASGMDVSKLGGGCWDVIAWRESELAFVEMKQLTAAWHDAIRSSQRLWLEAALGIGIGVESFLILEWTRC